MRAEAGDKLSKFLYEIGTPRFFVDGMMVVDVAEFDDGHGGAEEGYVEFFVRDEDGGFVPHPEKGIMRGRIEGKVEVRLR